MRTQRQIFEKAPRFRGFYKGEIWCGYVRDTKKGRAAAISCGATHFAPLTFHRLDAGDIPASSRWGCFYYKFKTRNAFDINAFEDVVVDVLSMYVANPKATGMRVAKSTDGMYELYLPPWLFMHNKIPCTLYAYYEAAARFLASSMKDLGFEVWPFEPGLIPVDREDFFREAPSEEIRVLSGLDTKTLEFMRKSPTRKPPALPEFPPLRPLVNENGDFTCGQNHSDAGVKCAITLGARLRAKSIAEFTQRDALRAVDGTFTLDCGVEEALRILIATGHIVRCPDLSPLSKGGRPHWFLVNPGMHTDSGTKLNPEMCLARLIHREACWRNSQRASVNLACRFSPS